MTRIPYGLAAIILASANASGAAPAPAHARSLAATCASCHGTPGSDIPPLGRRPATELVKAMQDFRSGARSGTVMPQLARGYTSEDIEAIAQWYEAHEQ